MENSNTQNSNNSVSNSGVTVNLNTQKSSITPLRMGLYFAMAYSIVFLLLYVFQFPINSTILSVIFSPASTFINALYIFGGNAAVITLVYILANASIYFLIGYIIGSFISPSTQPNLTSSVPTGTVVPLSSKTSPGKLLKWMFLVALSWAIIGLVFADAFESLGAIWLVVGACVIGAFSLVSLSDAISAFKNKKTSRGIQYLLLIIILPIVGVGVGCGTCLVAADFVNF